MDAIAPTLVEPPATAEKNYSTSYTIESLVGKSLKELIAMTDEEIEKYLAPALLACPAVVVATHPHVIKPKTPGRKLTPTSALGRSLAGSGAGVKPPVDKATKQQHSLDFMKQMLEQRIASVDMEIAKKNSV